MPSPLESLAVPADGTTATAANFGKPTSDFAKAVAGATAGNPDANNGNPIVPRSFTTGLLGFTNALGVTTYPGASPGSVQDAGGAHSVTVPNGQQLVVCAITPDGSVTAGAIVTVNDGSHTAQVAALAAGAVSWLPGAASPLVLDQNWILTTPQHAGWLGYYVLRDSAVQPVARQVTNASTYTVPAGLTLWLLGFTGVQNSANVYLQCAGGSQYLGLAPNAPTAYNTGFGNGNGLSIPIPLSAGTVLQSSAATAVGFWGVLI